MTTAWRTPGHAGPWIVLALYAALITYVSHIPNLDPPGDTPDWLFHVGEYGGLAVLAALALSPPGRPRGTRLALAAAGGLAFAGVDELHQSVVPGRSATLRDLGFDALGICAGLAAFAAWRAWRSDEASPRVDLMSRGACHLCEEAEQVMGPILEEMGLTLRKIDVDQDAELARRYGHEVPVVLINGRKAFKHRVDPERLRRRLGSAARRRT
jgi:VanZ family protein